MEKYKKVIKINEFKTSTQKWSKEFELPDSSYSVSDVQDYFECTVKKTWRKD